jgi:hypothetical protein
MVLLTMKCLFCIFNMLKGEYYMTKWYVVNSHARRGPDEILFSFYPRTTLNSGLVLFKKRTKNISSARLQLIV